MSRRSSSGSWADIATKEEEVDRMLRARLFVDLHAIVKQGVRASVERYSLKELEVFFRFKRETALTDALPKLLAVERALELGHVGDLTEEMRSVAESYNRDDCLSAWKLRDWLESKRAELVDTGEQVPRPTPQSGEPSETIDERRQRALFLMDKLLQDVPTEREERSDEQQACWLLAYMLEWHRREGKAPWWEFYRLRDLSDEELVDEKGAVSGLRFVERVGGTKRSPIDRYSFQPQETKIRRKNTLHTTDGEKFGDVTAVDLVAGTIDIKKRGVVADVHSNALFAHSFVSSDKLSDSLLRLARWVASHGIDADGPYRAARDLVLRRFPRLPTGVSELQRKDEDTVVAAERLALELDGGVLPIQGPPGSGKTYAGARMICELVKAGKKVGVTAVSHKVIRKLLQDTVDAAKKDNATVRCLQKVSGKPSDENPDIWEVSANGDVETLLSVGQTDVVGGTAWLWAREEFSEAVDVLFVDEAGQMSLANVLAVGSGRQEHRLAWRSSATRPAPAGQSSRRNRRIGAGASSWRAQDHARGPWAISARNMALASRDL